MKKALLIFPNPISEMPTGFAYLAAVLKQKGYKVKAVVNTFEHFLKNDDFIRIAEEFQPSIIGFNLSTFRLLNTYEMVDKIKKYGSMLIAGGPHATSNPEEVIKNGVDIVVRNEGEETLSELCDFWSNAKALTLESIKGISYKDRDGRIVHNPAREYISDLRHLPSPDFSCFNSEDFCTSEGLLKGLHRIYLSRGCPGGCAFCDRSVFGRKVRFRSIEEVIKEIKYRKETFRFSSFVIADDTFTFNKQYVRDFCNAIKENKLNIIWKCCTRADVVDPEILKLIREAGCYLLAYGIESGDPDTLKKIGKGITLQQADKAVESAAAGGFRVYVNLMTGFPWEDERSVLNNIKYINKHFKEVYFYQVSGAVVPYPGTEIYELYKKQGGFEEWWLKKEYQNYGIQIHQNVENPYRFSTFYQRNLYDDTFIWEDTFFKYTDKYKEKVKEMAFIIGKRNLVSLYPSPVKRWWIYNLCKLSRMVYELNPSLEKRLVSKIAAMFNFKSQFHNRGPLGYLFRRN